MGLLQRSFVIMAKKNSSLTRLQTSLILSMTGNCLLAQKNTDHLKKILKLSARYYNVQCRIKKENNETIVFSGSSSCSK